ncbi:MAG TPA: hypothetical protein VF026_29685 [Ktedonobacteraceae bacterium]
MVAPSLWRAAAVRSDDPCRPRVGARPFSAPDVWRRSALLRFLGKDGGTFGLMGIGFGLMFSPTIAAVFNVTPPNRAGLGSSMFNTSRQVGNTLGIAVFGTLVVQFFSRNLVSQLTGRGVSRALSTTIAQWIAAAGADAATDLSRHTFPLLRSPTTRRLPRPSWTRFIARFSFAVSLCWLVPWCLR